MKYQEKKKSALLKNLKLVFYRLPDQTHFNVFHKKNQKFISKL